VGLSAREQDVKYQCLNHYYTTLLSSIWSELHLYIHWFCYW